MGCDGGTIPRRDELVRTKKKPEKVERDIENAAKWKYCSLTQVALREPIVACYLGRLYNKEAVIEALLAKTIAENENANHIRNLKDIKTLNLTKNTAFDTTKADKGDDFKDYNIAQFICPVVGIEMNGKHRFCAIWSCGCVVSEKALKEVKSEVCHKCGKSYKEEDVVVLHGTDEEIEEYRSRRTNKRDPGQSSKSKKEAQGDKAQTDVKNEIDDDKPSTSGLQSSSISATTDKRKLIAGGESSSTKPSNGTNPATAKKRESEGSGSTVSKKSKSIQSDPSSSKVFKSLFTTSEAAKNQPRAHWVTHNPLYY